MDHNHNHPSNHSTVDRLTSTATTATASSATNHHKAIAIGDHNPSTLLTATNIKEIGERDSFETIVNACGVTNIDQQIIDPQEPIILNLIQSNAKDYQSMAMKNRTVVNSVGSAVASIHFASSHLQQQPPPPSVTTTAAQAVITVVAPSTQSLEMISSQPVVVQVTNDANHYITVANDNNPHHPHHHNHHSHHHQQQPHHHQQQQQQQQHTVADVEASAVSVPATVVSNAIKLEETGPDHQTPPTYDDYNSVYSNGSNSAGQMTYYVTDSYTPSYYNPTGVNLSETYVVMDAPNPNPDPISNHQHVSTQNVSVPVTSIQSLSQRQQITNNGLLQQHRDSVNQTMIQDEDFKTYQPSRMSIQPQTVNWLIQNYETADGVSLPRSTLYSHYQQHCQQNQIEPVNAASFGKLIRSVFVGLRTRRLGTRGNSKYHYYGIRIKANSVLNNESDIGVENNATMPPVKRSKTSNNQNQLHQQTTANGNKTIITTAITNNGLVATDNQNNSSTINKNNQVLNDLNHVMNSKESLQSYLGDSTQLLDMVWPSQQTPVNESNSTANSSSPISTINNNTTNGNNNINKIDANNERNVSEDSNVRESKNSNVADSATNLNRGCEEDNSVTTTTTMTSTTNSTMLDYTNRSTTTISTTTTTTTANDSNTDRIERDNDVREDGRRDHHQQQQQSDSQKMLNIFIKNYRTHYDHIIKALSDLNFQEIELIWLSFWQPDQHNHLLHHHHHNHLLQQHQNHTSNDNDCLNIEFLKDLTKTEFAQWITQTDFTMYNSIITVLLLPNLLKPIPQLLTQQIRNFAKCINKWMLNALNGYPEEFVRMKTLAVSALSHMLRRYTSLNHLSTAACAVLKNQQQVIQMINDLNKVDFKNVMEQASWACECDMETIHQIENSFKAFLQEENPCERWALWCEQVLDRSLINQNNTAVKQFFFKWEFYSSLVMRDLTLRSAQSFGSFHLIRLLFDEYIFYLVEQRIAKTSGITPLQLLSQV
ncbi:DNA-binding protein RFX2 [Sarcoptes scabiei]|uniref:DNA-binding protein RFX2 n=1 Tax=Sarcoptes scabiei TaxID=52283 RepID=A0A834R1T7_SARSC|nr:DNA-binding protein RFX2 [Sarcoptes scabiei]